MDAVSSRGVVMSLSGSLSCQASLLRHPISRRCLSSAVSTRGRRLAHTHRPVSRATPRPASTTSVRGPLHLRAVVENVQAPAGEEPVAESQRGPEGAAGLPSTLPCCCSGSEEGTPAPAAAESQEGVATSAKGDGFKKALLWGAAVALPLAVVALNPSLLPFDIDDVQDWADEAVYFASHELNRAVNSQLGGSGPLAPGLLSIVFGAGIVTSFAPCTLSVLPLTIGYIAGFHSDKPEDDRQAAVIVNAVFFALGLATTFSTLGISAALAGKAYGQMGPGLPIAVSAVTMYMGLNLLGLVRFQAPSLFSNFDAKEAAANLPEPVQMLLGGMAFALLASPCSTPVLASLLGYVASSEDVLVGFALLLAYTFGRVMPVLVAASFTGSMKQLLSLRKYSRWINPASGALLLGIGTFSMLNRVFPEATAMAMGASHMGFGRM